MGLDVYLFHSNSWEESLEKETEYNNKRNDIYERARNLFPDLRDDANAFWNNLQVKEYMSLEQKKLCEEYGIPEGEWYIGSIVKVELDSKLYPENLFKIGYFRSSYNPAGFNSVVKSIIGQDLYDIFPHRDEETENDNGYFKPDWEYARSAISEMIENFETFIDSERSEYTVVQVETRNSFCGDEKFNGSDNPALHYASSQNEALQHFFDVKETHDLTSNFGALSGDFFLNSPIHVYAAIKGDAGPFSGQCIYLICSGEEVKENYKWYYESAKIVEETIDYVLSQPDPENYRVIWSG